MLYSPLIYNHLYCFLHSLLCCQSLSLVELIARNDFQSFYLFYNSLNIYLISLKQRKNFQYYLLRFVIASLSVQIMHQVEHYLQSRESRNTFGLSKEISKKLFFFKMICNYILYIIETNRHSKSTERSEFAIKNISSAFPNLHYSLIKRF